MVGRSRSMICRLRSMVGHLVKVSFSLVCDIRHIAIVVVSMVGDVLGPAIRQRHGVGAFNVACTIRCLPCVEVCSCVVVVHSIFKAVRLGLVRVDRRSRGVIGRCRGMVCRCRSRSRSRGVVDRCRVVVRGVPSLSKDCWQKSSNCDESLQESILWLGFAQNWDLRNNTSKTDVALWRYKCMDWMGLGYVDLWVG